MVAAIYMSLGDQTIPHAFYFGSNFAAIFLVITIVVVAAVNFFLLYKTVVHIILLFFDFSEYVKTPCESCASSLNYKEGIIIEHLI